MKYAESPHYVQKFIDRIIDKEKGFVDNPSDLGGATRFGITEAVARANGYYGDMSYLPLDFARDIYAKEYYYSPNLHIISSESQKIAEEVLDSGVNTGVTRAVKWLQIALNALNNNETYFEDIPEDGLLGARTQAALRKFLLKRGKEGEEVLHTALNCLQGAYYIDISRSRPKNETFTYGWLANRVVL